MTDRHEISKYPAEPAGNSAQCPEPPDRRDDDTAWDDDGLDTGGDTLDAGDDGFDVSGDWIEVD